MTKNEYLEMPWGIEDTIKNINEIKENFKVILINKNLDGKASDDVKELEFDFDRAINALEKQKEKKMVIKNDNGRPRRACGGCGCFILPASRFCSKCGQKLDWSEEQ